MKSFVSRLADDLTEAVKASHDAKAFDYNGFQFTRIEAHDDIWFSPALGAGFIDSPGTAAKNFARLLPKKNQ